VSCKSEKELCKRAFSSFDGQTDRYNCPAYSKFLHIFTPEKVYELHEQIEKRDVMIKYLLESLLTKVTHNHVHCRRCEHMCPTKQKDEK
jgi:predicted Zn-dependent peptidase